MGVDVSSRGVGAGAEFAQRDGVFDAIAICSGLVGLLSTIYLAYRAVEGLLRLRRSRDAYPAKRAQSTSVQTSDWTDRCRGALIGHAVGDALNLPAESLPRWLVRLRYPRGPAMRRGLVRFVRRAGDVSDDTQLTICVARSFEAGRYRSDLFLSELAAWSQIRVGAGRACTQAAKRLRLGTYRGGESSEGNGAAIRVVPLAILTSGKSLSDLALLVERNARATHDELAAVRGATAIAILVREALVAPMNAFADEGELLRAIDLAMAVSKFDAILSARGAIDSDAELEAHLGIVGTSGHVYQCVPAAMLVLLRHRLDFESAMRAIFFAGGDTDSIGAIVGSIIGAQVGLRALPNHWAERVQHREYLCQLADAISLTAAEAC